MVYISQFWIFFGALLSLNALDRWNTKCKELTVNASLKSEVFLPCHFNISCYNETERVKWTKDFDWSRYSSLVTIMINGRIFFDSPSEGRVSSFPNLARGGNFSILIHDLQSSDIGTCELNSECWRVKIIELPESKISPFSETEELNSNHNAWLFFFAGAGIFTILFIIFNRTGLQNRLQSLTEKCMRSTKSSSTTEEHHEEHGSSSQTSNIQQAFKTPDLNDSTTSTVNYVFQA